MKLIRFGELENEKPGLLLPDGHRIDATAFGEDYNEAFFATNGLERLEYWLADHHSSCPSIDENVRWGSCIARPSKIVCIGLNYARHAAESGMEVPSEPVLFFKSTSALCGPYDDLVIPRNGTKVDWEVELAVIIDKRASYVAREKAMAYVAGYAIHNDYSERKFQLEQGGQWVKGKSSDTFAPLGPYLATKEEITDPHQLSLWLTVNGEKVQNSNTSDFIFDIPTIVSYVSSFMTLLPGDVISTGTPEGVGLGFDPPRYLQPGDVVSLGIDGLGVASQKIVAYSSDHNNL